MVQSQWCPECKGFYEHIKGRCVGCDLSEDQWKDMPQDEIDPTLSTQKDWSRYSWIVIEDERPVHHSPSKKKSVEYLHEHIGGDKSTSRVRTGLYRYDEDHLIGKPDALKREGIWQKVFT